ncbi:hypothetical protein [Caviibacterium pharyngocola]|uniref:Uncharacterized protein n=1 Tax=Caviibacterium pharyngocola TaxID=28159 RepID=A0A2M8RY27_9PAST|nr:hypothetical protein [Caviibacterium pharyngocola]PJG83789.1 hypothetical protein CVP04_01470 [Caviibacterium pharyngocola]
MNYQDYIKMNQIGVYSIAFPTEKVVETLENAVLDERGGVKFEIVKNPFADKKVIEVGEDGLFFSVRAEFKNLTKELVAHKTYELSQDGVSFEVELEARSQLYQIIPPSSEIYNFFYNRTTEMLIVNSNSKRSKTAIMQLIQVFGLAGVKSIIVSDEKLGINKRFVDFIENQTPMFKFVNFNHTATLRKDTHNEKSHRTCRHLDSAKGKENALQVLNDGFYVQSLEMIYLDVLRFKLDEDLHIRNMRFKDYATTLRNLHSDEAFYYKRGRFYEYIGMQYDTLNKIMRSTVLEFTQETKLEQFA